MLSSVFIPILACAASVTKATALVIKATASRSCLSTEVDQEGTCPPEGGRSLLQTSSHTRYQRTDLQLGATWQDPEDVQEAYSHQPALFNAMQRSRSHSTFTEVQTESCSSCKKSEAVGIEQQSSACCLSGGQADWGTSHMFQVLGAQYNKGKLHVFGNGEIETNTAQCYKECEVTWFEYGGDAGTKASALLVDELAAESQQRLGTLEVKSPAHPDCEPEEWREAALIVSRYFSHNLYHNLIDTLFTTFLTASHLSLELGCSSDKVEVFVQDLDWSAGPDNFDLLWEHMFGAPVRTTTSMSGCYSRVMYGSLFNQRFYKWPASQPNRVYRSAVMIPWMMAYSRNLRASFGQNSTVTMSANSDFASNHFILAHHNRWPSDLWNFSWEMLEGGPAIHREDMATFPIKTQVQMVMAARGIIAAEGAVHTHQLFMKPFSALLIITDSSNDDADCKGLPETWHDSVALHLGHTTLNWKTCNEDFESWDLQTRESKIQAVWNLLLTKWGAAAKESKSLSCFVLKPSTQNLAWPSCDKEVSLPVDGTKGFAKCGGWSIGSAITSGGEYFQDDLALSEAELQEQHSFTHKHLEQDQTS